jgi:hypothetical protein
MKLISARGLAVLMLHVAMVAFVIVGTRYYVLRNHELEQTRQIYQELASGYAKDARRLENRRDSELPEIREWATRWGRYYGEMERRYAKAALNPQAEMPPDLLPPH